MLVEIRAQPVQLFFVGKFGRGDRLVKFGRPDFIIALRQMVPIAALRRDRLHPIIAHFAVGAVLVIHVFAVIIGLSLFALLRLRAGFGLASFAFAVIFAVALLVLRILCIVAAFVGIGRIDITFGKVQMLQHGLSQRGKGALIIQRKRQRIKVTTGIFLNPTAQHINASGGTGWHGRAGQPFAHDQG